VEFHGNEEVDSTEKEKTIERQLKIEKTIETTTIEDCDKQVGMHLLQNLL